MMYRSGVTRLPRLLATLVLMLALGLPLASHGRIEAYQFDDPDKEQTYRKLIGELRCLVCQNQNLADSNAELAQDMRRKTYEMVLNGTPENEVIEFMVDRYGDFVMYRPPLKATTMFLWFGPLILFVIAAVIVTVFLRKQKRQPVDEVVPEQQQKRAHSLLDDDK